MFKKRVGFIRDLERDILVLERRQKREISKLNSDIENEIKKVMRREHPGCYPEVLRLKIVDFATNSRKRQPLKVVISNLNGKYMSSSGKWIEPLDDFDLEIEGDNRISAQKMLDICSKLSEDLGILVEFERITSKI